MKRRLLQASVRRRVFATTAVHRLRGDPVPDRALVVERRVDQRRGAAGAAGAVLPAFDGHPVEASPANYKLLVENDQARLLEMTVKAGEKDEVHSHPSEMVYFISGGKARVHLPHGETMEAEFPDGGVMNHEEWTHQVETSETSTSTPSSSS